MLPLPFHETDSVALGISEQRERHDVRNLCRRYDDLATELFRFVEVCLQIIDLDAEGHICLVTLTGWSYSAIDSALAAGIR